MKRFLGFLLGFLGVPRGSSGSSGSSGGSSEEDQRNRSSEAPEVLRGTPRNPEELRNRLLNALKKFRLAIALLTERRLGLYAVVDGLFFLVAFGISFGGASSRDFYLPFFILPALFIGVSMMSDTVAVERRSGTLDLALTSPGARFYFERRVLAVAVLMVAQGWLGVAIAHWLAEDFAYSGPYLQVVIVSLFLAAVVLNWSVHLKTTGAVMFATYATVLAFSPWFFSNPIHPPTTMDPMTVGDYIDYAQRNLVLAVAAVIFYLYARQRLARPERLIA